MVLTALGSSQQQLRDGDVLVIAQKIVSKCEGRLVRLDTVVPSSRALELASEVDKDPRLVELVLSESTEVVRKRRSVLIVAHRLGFVTANAGIDQSNVSHGEGGETALLLPENPDESCVRLRVKLKSLTGADVAVVINDSHGRAFRNGTVGVALGAAGLPALDDRRGQPDLYGRQLQSTEVAFADEIASAASLLMGQADEGRPVVIVRGVPKQARDGSAAELVRAKQMDLFRVPTAETLLRSRRSIRRYTQEPVSDAVLGDILEMAASAPSAHNRQPWRFAVLRESDPKNRLATAMGERLRADRLRDGDPLEAINRDVSRSFARITSAPVVMLVCLTMEDMDRYPDQRRTAAEHQMAVQGVAMATQNLLLAIHAAGLGASLMCAPLFCPDTVRSALELPAQWEPQALITVGYPADGGKPFRRRKAIENVRVIRT
jgi:coenzyme F420-0:L-glutamate ligase/coenzyme F420-1:gamma-L-glutamate ligase